jgi:type VI protein secretion system component VasK
MPEGMLECPSGSFIVSLLPTFLAFWKGEGPWKLAALVMSLVSFVVFVLWTMIAANWPGTTLLAWGPFLCTWGLGWFFASLAIQERAKERAKDLAWRKASDDITRIRNRS